MKTNYWRTLPAWKRKFALWILGLLLFYTIAGVFILPPIIRAVAVHQISEQLDRKVSIQKVSVNPFAPSIAIHGLLIQDKDGQPLISLDEVYVNFEISSIFRKAWTFREIAVTKPFARAQMNKDYTCNFSDIIQKFSNNAPDAAAKQPAKPLLVRVEKLKVIDASLSLADYTIPTPFKRVVGPVELTVNNFSTEANSDSSGVLFGKTDADEYFAWHGNFCLTPLRSTGNVAVFDVTMSKFKPLYEDIVNFEIRSGQSGFCADYRFEWSASNHVAAVTNAAFGISHFRLAQPGDTNDIIDLDHFTETGVSGDLQSHHGEIGHIEFSGASLFLQRGTNKAVNVVEIATPKVAKPVAPGGILLFLNAITNGVATLIRTTNQWTGIIHEVDFTNCGAHLLDLANARPATLDLDNVNVNIKDISNYPNSNVTAAVSMNWNKTGTIKVGATALISPPTVDVRVALDQVDLSTLAPYAESQMNLSVLQADLGMNGELRLHMPHHGSLPKLTFRGDTWLDHFHAVDGIKGEDLLKWDSIRVSGIAANLNPPTVSIGEISVNSVATRVIIETNGIINLISAMQPPTTNSAPRAKPPAVAKTSAASGTNAFDVASMPKVSIDRVVVTNTQISFTDHSMTPNAHMVIQDAGGTITGISSTELQHGNINLHALVDGVSPAEITGSINPFSNKLTNQVSIFMTNMDLLPTSPYAGKFAGYRIARGALSVDLVYTVVGRKLKSENLITLNQFTFGDKVDSPDATKLPVRLAIAILKDRQGKIILNVPIEGSLDDPKFHIGKVVERTLANILVKVATSPFSLLGAAFGGGGGELSYEDFAPASIELTGATKKKLDLLIKALYNRPGLQVEISGSIDPENDRYGLQQIAFEKELRTREWQSLRKSQKESTTPGEINLTPEQRSDLVNDLYDDALSSRRITLTILAANTNLAAIASQIRPPQYNLEKPVQYLTKSSGPGPKPPIVHSKSPQQKLAPPANPKEALLIAIIPISENDLEALAMKRAKAVRSYVLNSGQVDANRLFLGQSPGGTLRQDGSRVYLQLE
jgi:hypothetical protein